jgi:hypothetical protein
MNKFLINPSAEWVLSCPEISGIAYRGNWSDGIARQAFFSVYADRDSAVAAAAAANLHPITETYGRGYTTIFVVPRHPEQPQ